MARVEPILVASAGNSRYQETNQLPASTTGSSSSSSLAFSLFDRSEIVGGTTANALDSCSLKRKRSLKIEIPNVLQEISTDAFKGSTAKGQSDGAVCFTDPGVGVFSLKGQKKFMEDAHKIFSSSNGNKRFFGVYDGHGGNKAAEFAADNLHLKILEMLEKSSENKGKEEAVKAGYLKTDEEFLKQGWDSGACCVTAVIEGREMVVSNLGDCRAVVCRVGVAEALTTDHRPTREDERRRIEEKGGYVEIHRGTWRVHGTLAISRSIGDAHLKDWVVAEPDTRVVHLTPDMQFLVLASDGLWDEVGNQEAVDIVMQSLSKSPGVSVVKLKPKRIFRRTMPIVQQKTREDEPCWVSGSRPPPSKSRKISEAKKMKMRSDNENEKPNNGGLLGACKELVDLAVSRGSLDDVTVMILDLAHYNKG